MLSSSTSKCDCVSGEVVAWRTLDVEYGARLVRGTEAQPVDPCRGCMRPVGDTPPLTVITPCRRQDAMHSTRVHLCDLAECEEYACDAVLAWAEKREGLVEFGGRCAADSGSERVAVEAAVVRLQALFSYDVGHQCSKCRCFAWRMSASGALTTKRCGRCLRSWYCSVECQRQAWPEHKPYCVLGSEAPAFQVEVPADLLRSESAASVLLAAGFLHNGEGVCASQSCFVRLHPGGCALEKKMYVGAQTAIDEPRRELRFCSVPCSLALLTPLIKNGSVTTDHSGAASSWDSAPVQ